MNSTHLWADGDKTNPAHRERRALMKQLTLVSVLCDPGPKPDSKTRKNAWTEKRVYDQWEVGGIWKATEKSSDIKRLKGLVLRGHPSVRKWQLQSVAGAGWVEKDILYSFKRSSFWFFFFSFLLLLFLFPSLLLSLFHCLFLSLPLSHWSFPGSAFCLASITLCFEITSPWASSHTSSQGRFPACSNSGDVQKRHMVRFDFPFILKFSSISMKTPWEILHKLFTKALISMDLLVHLRTSLEFTSAHKQSTWISRMLFPMCGSQSTQICRTKSEGRENLLSSFLWPGTLNLNI